LDVIVLLLNGLAPRGTADDCKLSTAEHLTSYQRPRHRSFAAACPRMWNSVPTTLRSIDDCPRELVS